MLSFTEDITHLQKVEDNSETYLGSSDKRFSDWPFFEEFAWVSFRFSSFPRYQTYLHQVDSPVSVPDQGTG